MQPLRLGYRHLRFLRPGQLQYAPPPWQNIPSRLHQLFCTSAPHRARGRSAGKSEDEHFSVNYFEEEADSPARKRRRIYTNEDVKDAEDDEIEEMIKDIDTFKVDATVPEDIKQSMFTQDQLRQIEANSAFDVAVLPHQISPQKPIPRQAQVYLNKLNEALDEANLESSNAGTRSRLWRWYTRSKPNVPGLVHMIPRPGWDLLWQTQASDSVDNTDRLSHLRILADDKIKAGWELSEDERFTRLEGTFLGGDHNTALELFEAAMTGRDGDKPAFLEMGVRMYADRGYPQRAHELLDLVFAKDRTANPRLVIPVLKAYTEQKDSEALNAVWNLYQQLQKRLSSDMAMEDFDRVALMFLAVGHKDYALAVFRDMMMCGEARKRGAMYNVDSSGAISRIGDFLALGTAQQTTDLGLDAIKHLPRRFQNKFFYASWLRKLISEGELNAAAQVIELMYERRVKPDAKHMNGLIAAWLREGSNTSRDQAEAIAWSMIQERIDFTSRRPDRTSNYGSTTKKDIHDSPEDIKIPTRTSRPVPPATIETFCILLQHYLRRSMFQHVRHLRDLLPEAELHMNSYFMNHLLYAELRNRGYRSAWSRFEVLSQHVSPDVETFVCLWECMKSHVHEGRNHQHAEPDGLPTPRDLFKTMLRWFDGLSGQEVRMTTEDMNVDVYHDILRVLCISHDVEGTMVAMHVFRTRFGLVPNEATMRMLLMQIARLSPAPKKPSYPRSLRKRVQARPKSARDQDMQHATSMLEVVRSHRVQQYEKEGYDLDELGEDGRAEEQYRSCLALLFAVVRRRRDAPLESHHKGVSIAACDMGVENFDVEQSMRLVVDDDE